MTLKLLKRFIKITPVQHVIQLVIFETDDCIIIEHYRGYLMRTICTI